jgi:hypothetical protein
MANQEARAKFEAERKRLQEAQRINENIGTMLRDMDPRLGNIEADRDTSLKSTLAHISLVAWLGRHLEAEHWAVLCV